MYKFHEVTDLEMKVDLSLGLDIGEFLSGSVKREFFVIYEGPEMGGKKDDFFKELQQFIKDKTNERN